MTGKSVRSVVICSASLGCVGIITTLIGLLFILLAQKEVRPPYYDAEYTRHVGSNLPLIIGKFQAANVEIDNNNCRPLSD